jgi:hypothetical protein
LRSEEPAACIGYFFSVDVGREVGHGRRREESRIAEDEMIWLAGVRQGAETITDAGGAEDYIKHLLAIHVLHLEQMISSC